METQQIFASQWGFQYGEFTIIALLETTHSWFEMLEMEVKLTLVQCFST